MQNEIFEKQTNQPKYIQMYNYYKQLILKGSLSSGTKMPSIRKCCENFSISKTTVETAYMQLCAEGYLISKPQSGFYVCKLENEYAQEKTYLKHSDSTQNPKIKYNLISSSGDTQSFNFALWTRYVKSAFRQDTRLISYGESQGEQDLRLAIASYVGSERNVVCSADQIVVGAGTQSLLQILCAINSDVKSLAYFGEIFKQGMAVFEDYCFDVFQFDTSEESLSNLEKNGTKMIYVSPSHMNKLGEVLSISQRMKILSFAKKNNCLVIEDDYGSEFRYNSKPVPSMQGIDSGENVVYLGTFSSLLIPSIRISFMVLPEKLLQKYEKRRELYNQTASKVEQIALCQFIRDGHLNSQIRKQRKNYIEKAKLIVKMSKQIFPKEIKFSLCQAGYLIKIEIETKKTKDEIIDFAKRKGVLISFVEKDEKDKLIFVISSACVSNDEIENMLIALNEALNI